MAKPRVYLDLDDTLIKSFQPNMVPVYWLPFCVPTDNTAISVVRPRLKEFLNNLKSWTDVFIFTAANYSYGKAIMSFIDDEIPVHSIESESSGSLGGYEQWVLCDNCEFHHPKSQYKLECLGEVSTRKYIEVVPFTPQLSKEDKHLPILERKIAKYFGREN